MKMRAIYMFLFAAFVGISLSSCEDSSSKSTLSSSEDFDLAFKQEERAQKHALASATDVLKRPSSDRPAGRAAIVLTRESFAQEVRDPFERSATGPTKPIEAELPKKRQREVLFSSYNFENLRLIAIVRSGKSIPPRALFVASDGVSKTIQQGEYFSRSEVLLASVNSDYVEIEIVDEELAQGLNMEQGERRAIYLKQE